MYTTTNFLIFCFECINIFLVLYVIMMNNCKTKKIFFFFVTISTNLLFEFYTEFNTQNFARLDNIMYKLNIDL